MTVMPMKGGTLHLSALAEARHRQSDSDGSGVKNSRASFTVSLAAKSEAGQLEQRRP